MTETAQRWVDQTLFHDPANNIKGNCAQAAVASLFGLRLDEVPNFSAATDAYEFWTSIEAFVEGQGYRLRYENSNYMPNVLYLACGRSSRGCSHMVLMKGGVLVHDPHPSREGIQTVDHVILLTPVDPAELKKK